jgi:hypothetical protein
MIIRKPLMHIYISVQFQYLPRLRLKQNRVNSTFLYKDLGFWSSHFENEMLKGFFVDENFECKFYTFLDLTTSSCEKCNYSPSGRNLRPCNYSL